ncbi:ABC transporter permease [Alkalibacterium sp. f15]|uniref:ABC transporter permease n=1 Tax=Alkalibacterium sp. f15 TaxID=3414029 RepID=UPI003BF83362
MSHHTLRKKIKPDNLSRLFKFDRAIWHGNKPSRSLLGVSIVIALIMTLPLLYVIYQSFLAGSESWMRLLDTRIPQLLWNTLSLGIAVTLTSTFIGVSLAWLVTRTDLPGRRIWRWLLALPLVVPPYVGAVTYIIVLGPRGWLYQAIQAAYGNDFSLTFDIYSFYGVFLVMTLFTYPYVYLVTSASLRKISQTYEEVGRSLGYNGFHIFFKIILPMLVPAIGAGGVLVFLYVISDFGAVSMLRYVTFTSAIYYQRAGFDIPSASVLSLVLIGITVIVLLIEKLMKKRKAYYQTKGIAKESQTLSLGKYKHVSLLYVIFIFLISVALPIIVLVYWTMIGAGSGLIDSSIFEYTLNSFQIAGATAGLSMILSVPLVYLYSRHHSVVSSLIYKLSYTGYALPGVIVALGLVFIFNNHIPFLYNTVFLVIIAQLIRFMPQVLQSGETAMNMISPRIDESARSLGHSTWKVIFFITLPAILPGLLAGGALVFVSSLKELPVTLMLRPPGFDTLAIRVYYQASEAIYAQAAPGALIIILVSILPLYYLLKNY